MEERSKSSLGRIQGKEGLFVCFFILQWVILEKIHTMLGMIQRIGKTGRCRTGKNCWSQLLEKAKEGGSPSHRREGKVHREGRSLCVDEVMRSLQVLFHCWRWNEREGV